jgi:hypothetical protein
VIVEHWRLIPEAGSGDDAETLLELNPEISEDTAWELVQMPTKDLASLVGWQSKTKHSILQKAKASYGLMDSVKDVGFLEPLVLLGAHLDGIHRLAVALHLNHETVPVWWAVEGRLEE